MANSKTTQSQDEFSDQEGTLERTSVPELLAHAWRDERSGCLRVAMGRADRSLQIRNGSPVAIEVRGEDDGFAQTLEDDGLIRPAERMEAERHARAKKCSEAAAILALRLLDAKRLYPFIRDSSRRQISETFEWQTGQYQWTSEPEKDATSAKPFDILRLIQEQLPRRWGSDRLFRSLMPSSKFYAEISPRFRRVARKLAEAGDPARRTIARLDGSFSIGQILGECAGSPDSAATLWTLLEVGALRLSEVRRRGGADPESIEFEVEIESMSSSTARAGKKNTSGDASSSKSKSEAISAALRVEIESLIEQLPDFDHYDALGLTLTASPAEIKRAYFKAAKKFHPDALARLGLQELSGDAGRVFARIAEAFETLSNEDKKAAYDASGSDEPEIDTARLAQAETSFRKGEILARMGNFEGALAYLEPAVSLWPEEPAYQAELGWALYKQQRSDADRAREHLEIANKQSPTVALISFRLGIVLRAQGETELSEAMLSHARSLDPAIEE